MTRKLSFVAAALVLVTLTGCGHRIMGPVKVEVDATPYEDIHGEGHTLAQYIANVQGADCPCNVCNPEVR